MQTKSIRLFFHINMVAALFVALKLLSPGNALAADTVEKWGVGATDVDFYIGMDGIGRDKYEKTVFGDIMLGYGIVDGLSAYLGTTLEANEYLSNGSGSTYLGLYGSPVDGDHFDFDWFFDVGLGGPGFTEFQVTPAFELNLDAAPDLTKFGIYTRIGVPLYGQNVTASPQAGDPPDMVYPEEHEFNFHLEGTFGTYFTVAEGHQLLLEFDMALNPGATDGEDTREIGGVAFGYNVGLTDSLEMINQVYLDIPQGGDVVAVGVFTGFIATLPSVGQD